ncbi:MAG TPA: hypothetical protein VGJ17_04040 [Candidatus Limnocylindrales bacterium]|jgi:hypothetical protein
MAVQAGRLGGRSGLRSAAVAVALPRIGPAVQPRPRVETAPAIARRRARTAVRAGRRANRVGLLLGAIAIIFVLGFFSLAQTVQVSTTAVDIDRLTNEQAALQGQRQQVISDLNRLGGASAIRKEGIDLGLNQLGAPLIVPAR